MEQLFFSRLKSNMESPDISNGRINPDSVRIYILTIKKINDADDGNDDSFS